MTHLHWVEAVINELQLQLKLDSLAFKNTPKLHEFGPCTEGEGGICQFGEVTIHQPKAASCRPCDILSI